MANPKHVEVVKQGAEAIEKWRKENPGVRLDLGKADLSSAVLWYANLNLATLTSTDLSDSSLAGTVFANTDLSTVKGLESVSHMGPSTIGIDTLFQSRGKIPETFLRGCGVPDEFIAYVPR